jgi:hypothetical protein
VWAGATSGGNTRYLARASLESQTTDGEGVAELGVDVGVVRVRGRRLRWQRVVLGEGVIGVPNDRRCGALAVGADQRHGHIIEDGERHR